jgi:hypothetical protein
MSLREVHDLSMANNVQGKKEPEGHKDEEKPPEATLNLYYTFWFGEDHT